MNEQEIAKISAKFQKIRDLAILLNNTSKRVDKAGITLTNVTTSQLDDLSALIKGSYALSGLIIQITEQTE